VSGNIESWDVFFLKLAKMVATRSKDPSTQVGAVIVRQDKTVASVGYNGFPRSMPDTPELYANRDEKYSRIIHAEINAVLHAREQLTGYTLYTYPLLPCDRCMVQMMQAGIKRIVSMEATKDVMERWGPVLEKTRKYATEGGIAVTIIPSVFVFT
jgi:dCMP deaminase